MKKILKFIFWIIIILLVIAFISNLMKDKSGEQAQQIQEPTMDAEEINEASLDELQSGLNNLENQLGELQIEDLGGLEE